MFSTLVSAASLISVAAAANVVVQVGATGDSFSPSTVTAAMGDTVTFQFTGNPHNVVESSFDAPCSPMSGGFSVATQTTKSEFMVNVTSTDPIYFYCSVLNHCSIGMVGIINPGAHSIADFTAAANGKSSQSPPNDPQGGVYVNANGVTSTAGGAAGTTATTTGGTTTAAGTSAASTSAASAKSSGLGYLPTAVPAAFAIVAGAVAAMV